jgi:hypothetical protein
MRIEHLRGIMDKRYHKHDYESVIKRASYWTKGGALGSLVVKALCYKPEGRRFNTR